MKVLKFFVTGLSLVLLIGSGGVAEAEGVQVDRCPAGDASYNPYCDVDGNGIIDVVDLSRVALRWQQSGDPTIAAGDAWNLTGNAGTTPGTDFLGTTDDVAFQIHVNGKRALRIEPASDAIFDFSPNLIGGYSGNGVGTDVLGATIAGGGRSAAPNRVMADFGTVGGGAANSTSSFAATVAGGETNQASGFAAVVGGGSANRAGAKFATVGGGIANEASGGHATVPGGLSNTAAGDYSFAAGRRAKATHAGAFVWGDATDADIASTDANQFIARASGGVDFYSNSDATLGVSLATNSGSWASLSDRAVKTDVVPVDSQEILAGLADVPISRWHYDGQDPSIRHIGPMAQDFYAAFGVGEDDRYISTVDADGVALASIQGLYEIVKEQKAQIAQLQQQNADLQARLAALERVVQSD